MEKRSGAGWENRLSFNRRGASGRSTRSGCSSSPNRADAQANSGDENDCAEKNRANILSDRGTDKHGNNRVETELGPLWVADSGHCHGAVIVGVRPEDVHLQQSSNENENRIEGKVRTSVFLGDQIVSEIDVRGKILIAKGSPDDGEPSDTVFVYLPRERLVVFSDRVPSNSLG